MTLWWIISLLVRALQLYGYKANESTLDAELLHDYEIKYEPKVHRLRWQGHILNLAAHSFLFVTEEESLESNNVDKYAVTLDEMERWRRCGPLGKLHNSVVYIQRSTIRIQRFKKLSHRRAPVRDNSTRWNDWDAMIKCAVGPGVRVAISRYFATYIDDECTPDELRSEN
jgi:hypothetical protein